MELTVQRFEKYLGQPVKNPYGGYVGTIVGFFSDVSGVVHTVVIERGDGTYAKYPVSQLTFTENSIVLIPTWKAEALNLIKQLETAKRRLKAVDELYSKGEIAAHAYQEFKKRLEDELIKLRGVSRDVKAKLKNRVKELEAQIEEIEKTIASVKMTFTAGEIGEKTFKHVLDMLRRGLDRCVAEKGDVNTTIAEIERVETEPVMPAAAKAVKAEEEGKAVGGDMVGEVLGEPLKIEILEEAAG